jgi:hypothetical protein
MVALSLVPPIPALVLSIVFAFESQQLLSRRAAHAADKIG